MVGVSAGPNVHGSEVTDSRAQARTWAAVAVAVPLESLPFCPQCSTTPPSLDPAPLRLRSYPPPPLRSSSSPTLHMAQMVLQVL